MDRVRTRKHRKLCSDNRACEGGSQERFALFVFWLEFFEINPGRAAATTANAQADVYGWRLRESSCLVGPGSGHGAKWLKGKARKNLPNSSHRVVAHRGEPASRSALILPYHLGFGEQIPAAPLGVHKALLTTVQRANALKAAAFDAQNRHRGILARTALRLNNLSVQFANVTGYFAAIRHSHR